MTSGVAVPHQRQFGYVWTPWRGDPHPQNCSTDLGPTSELHSSFRVNVAPHSIETTGWCWDASFGNGFSAMITNVTLDGDVICSNLANITRPGVPGTGAPNAQHGFVCAFDADQTKRAEKGEHTIAAIAHDGKYWRPVGKSPVCLKDGKITPCDTAA